jgi:peptidyl-tRNA hydrolase, PTH1 family
MTASAPIQLIVGLGNPGDEHQATRHNVGFWLVKRFVAWHGLELSPEKKFKGQVAKLQADQSMCWLLCPTTFMNLSGDAILALSKFYRIPPESILVVYDDLDFPVGVAKLKFGGGHGGHNGIRHSLQALSGKDFWRLRLGIGHPGNKDLVHRYVLSRPSKGDEANINKAIDDAVAILPAMIAGETELAMRQLHEREG